MEMPQLGIENGFYYCRLKFRGMEYDEWVERRKGRWQLEDGEELLSVIEKMEGTYGDTSTDDNLILPAAGMVRR